MSPRAPLQFFDILKQTGFSKSRKGPPILQFWKLCAFWALYIFRRLQTFPSCLIRVRFTLFVCSTWSTDVKHIMELSEYRPKQNRRPEPRKLAKDPDVFNLDVFWHYETFWKFLIASKVPPFFWKFATEWMFKKLRGSLLNFFGTVTLFKMLISRFVFEKFLKSPNGSPSF